MIAITKGEAVGKLETWNYNQFQVRDEEGNTNELADLLITFRDKVVKITVEVISYGSN